MFNSPNKSVGVINGVPDFPADGNDYVFQGDNTWKVLPPSPGKNLIINGAMNVAQRGTQRTGIVGDVFGGSGSTGKTIYLSDRFSFSPQLMSGTWTVEQSDDAPIGFSKSFKVTATAAITSIDLDGHLIFRHLIEGQNLQHLAYGTSEAKSMTLSFWVKSNKTGNASFQIVQNDNLSKMISKSYAINSANTWEYKTISIPADTAGNIDNDNGDGLHIEWWFNSGSNWTGGSEATTWSSYAKNRSNPSNLGVGGSVGDYFAITGIQLEVGDEATEFEHEDYGTTLIKCERYYQEYDNNGNGYMSGVTPGTAWNTSSTSGHNILFRQIMRDIPTFSSSGTFSVYSPVYGYSNASVNANSIGNAGASVTLGGASVTTGHSGYYVAGSASLVKLIFDAEL